MSNVDFSTIASVTENVKDHGVAATYELYPCYPNPFNPSTTIRYGLPIRAHVILTVFNTLGQAVAMLVNETEESGYHDVQFDGNGLASGMYVCRLQGGSNVQTRKLLLLK